MTNKYDKLFILPLTNKNYKKCYVSPHIQSFQVGVSSFSRINISFEHNSVTFLYLEYTALHSKYQNDTKRPYIRFHLYFIYLLGKTSIT